MFRADTPEAARAIVAELASRHDQGHGDVPERAETAEGREHPSNAPECEHRPFKADMQRSGRLCMNCLRPLEEGRVLRYGFQLIRRGQHAGSRACVVHLRCACGRRIQVLWRVQPPARYEDR